MVFGDGTQTRDFVFIDDVTRALAAAAAAPNVSRSIINIGSGVETSINDLITTLESVTGLPAEVLANSKMSGGLPRLVADLTRARSLLEYEPQVSLVEGIQRLLDQEPHLARKLTSRRALRASDH